MSIQILMKPFEHLRNNIEKHVQFSDSEFEILSGFFKQKKINKKEFLLQYGEISRLEGFVTQGLLKIYTIDYEGKDHTIYFADSDWWVGDIGSFTNQTPANLFIEAIEDSEILYISFEDKEKLFQELPKVEELFRRMGQFRLIALQQRLIDHLSKTADTRYEEFITKYPQIANRLTNLHIASYLGISHEFLSKIRRKRTHHK